MTVISPPLPPTSVTLAGAGSASLQPRPWGRWSLRGIALLYLVVLVVLPLATVVHTALRDGPAQVWADVTAPVALAALRLTLLTSLLAVLANAIMGVWLAWVLGRHRFPGLWLVDALLDLPFAIPTLVTGVLLVVLFGPAQPLGGWLRGQGVQVLFAPPAIVLALTFVTLPFVVRAVQPVLLELDRAEEEAAHTLGASEWTTFRRVVWPAIAPATLSGALLALARALGEFGSVVVVAGNIPFRTLTAPVYVFGEIESGNPRAASAVSLVLLALAFALIVAVDRLQHRPDEVPHG